MTTEQRLESIRAATATARPLPEGHLAAYDNDGTFLGYVDEDHVGSDAQTCCQTDDCGTGTSCPFDAVDALRDLETLRLYAASRSVA